MGGPKTVWSEKQETDKQILIQMAKQNNKPSEIFGFAKSHFDILTLKDMYERKSANNQPSILYQAWKKNNKSKHMILDYVAFRSKEMLKETDPDKFEFFNEYSKLKGVLESYNSSSFKSSFDEAAIQLNKCKSKVLLFGVPIKEFEKRKSLIKTNKEEIKKLLALFRKLDQELTFRMEYIQPDYLAFIKAENYEREKGGEQSLGKVYLDTWQNLLEEDKLLGRKRKHTPNEIISKMDFTTVPTDTFMVYLNSIDLNKAEKLHAMNEIAQKKYDSLQNSILDNNLVEHFVLSEKFISLKEKAFGYQSFTDVKKYVSPNFKLGDYPTIKQSEGPKPKYIPPVWRRPAHTWERIVGSPDPYRYLDPSVGTWVDKQTLQVIKGREKPDFSLVPLVGPVLDALKKWDEIKTKNGLPVSVRTYDSEAGIWREGKVRLISKDKIEITTWNPYKKETKTGWIGGWEKKIEEKPKAGWKDYALLTMNVTFAALDAVFMLQTVTRTAIRSAGARAVIPSAGKQQITYVNAMTKLERKEAVRLLNIAREKKSWATVFRELEVMAEGAEITPKIMRSYIREQSGKYMATRAARRAGRGIKDFFGNYLTLFGRKRYQARMVAEFFNEMRHTTNFQAMREIIQSLQAAKLPKGQERKAVHAIFNMMTSFSRRTQKLFKTELAKPGAWKKLMDLTSKYGMRQGMAKMVPQYARALAYGPNFRALEFVAFFYLIPKATAEPLDQLIKYMETRFEISEKEIEQKLIMPISPRKKSIESYDAAFED